MPDNFQGLADFMTSEPPAADSAPIADPAPVATAPALESPPVEPPAQPATMGQVEGNYVSEVEWPTLPDESPTDPFAQFADPAALQQIANDPQALLQRAQTAERLIRQQQQQWQQFGQYEEQARSLLGDPAHIPLAMELTANLFGGLQALDQSQPAPLNQFLDKVATVHPDTYNNLLIAMAQREIEPLMETLQPKLLERLGLRPDLIEAYRTLTITGQYTQGQDVQAELDFLQRMPRHQHDAFRALPQFKRDALMRATDEEARWEMDQLHKSFVAEQRDVAAATEREQQQEYERSVKFSDSIEQEYMTLFDSFTEQGKALGLDPVRAAGIAALAYTEFQKQMLAEKRTLRETDRLNLNKFERALVSGNQFEANKARNEVKALFNKVWRQTLNQHGQRKPAAAPPPTNQRPQDNANRNSAPQFDATSPETANGDHPSLAALMARQPQQAMRQFGWEPRV